MALRETYMDLIYMGSRKRKDLLSKLGAWGPWERVEGEGRINFKKRILGFVKPDVVEHTCNLSTWELGANIQKLTVPSTTQQI